MVHLHTRSAYSLLKSPFRVEDIVKSAKKAGFQSAVLSDLNGMFGTMAFIHLCRKEGIKPIIGMETRALLDEKELSLQLLARNDAGLQQLYALSSELSRDNSAKTVQELAQTLSDCFVIVLSIEDEMERLLMHNSLEEAEKRIETMHLLFEDRLVIALSMSDSRLRKEQNEWLKELAEKQGIEYAPLSYILYEKEEDVGSLKVLRAIEKGTILSDQRLDVRMGRFFRSKSDMEAIYGTEDMLKTQEIADACTIELAFEKSGLPAFENKLGISSEDYLKKLAHAGLKKRLEGRISPEYANRLAYELDTIISMGFADYFLIVWDFIRFARSKNILVGPGRGSAAGSLVAWCLGITHVDPVANRLLFERFLNPERISLPDIDTDVPDDRREEVIAYLRKKYGSDHVAQIITFSNMKARAALRDVGRVMTIPVRTIDSLCKLVPSVPGMSLEKAFGQVPAFARLVNQDKQTRTLYETAKILEGLPRHTSIHAAGIVLSRLPIEKVCPTVELEGSMAATQFTMEYLEELGLIKMDLLALRNLTIIAKVTENIARDLNLQIDIQKIDLNDPAVYDLLCRVDTMGVFQLESDGIRQLVRRMQPRTFEDISQIIALYRPGPMQNISAFLERRNNPAKIQYIHPLLEDILRDTFGIPIYQEQLMQIAVKIGGFSLAQADSLRKAMSKKKRDLMESYRQEFLAGAEKRGIDGQSARTIFEWMERFADYGFNKSHSYAYGLIVYQMAWLKARFPLYFYQALLESVMGSDIKTSQYVHECLRRNIQVLPVDINASQKQVAIENGALRLPFSVLKGVGKIAWSKILDERSKRSFDNVYDFLGRMEMARVPENILHILIDAGALDGYGIERATLKRNLSRMLEYCHLIRVDGEQTLFDYDIVSRPKLYEVEANAMELIENEYKAYGFYLSKHPAWQMRKKYFANLPCLDELSGLTGWVKAVGMVRTMKEHKTKTGAMMCFMNIEDESGSLDLAVMPDLYAQQKMNMAAGRIIYMEGKKDRPGSILAKKIQWIE